MEVQIPIHTVFDVPSLLQAVAADTVLAAAQSIALGFQQRFRSWDSAAVGWNLTWLVSALSVSLDIVCNFAFYD
ncbi:hypothetical protein JHK84_036874 [Glycine max]|nr:hypothetical protein JHK84_036874 [Glycine max]